MKLHNSPLSTEKITALVTISSEIKKLAEGKKTGENLNELSDKIQKALVDCLGDESITPDEIYYNGSFSSEPLCLGDEVYHGDLQGIIIGFIRTLSPNPEKDGFTISYIFNPKITNGITYPEHNVQLQVDEAVLYCSVKHVTKRNK